MKQGVLQPGHIAVLFISTRPETSETYTFFDEATLQSAGEIEGFLGWDSVRNGIHGIFISYWKDERAVEIWKNHTLHRRAKELGKGEFYSFYRSVVTQISHVSEWERDSIL
ncbi:MAG: antibiotic biosynthesis monooxygenase family protein [Bacteroidia bacterium]